MSRLIVKNLPKKVTEKQLRDHFSSTGVVTDVQLKYTPDGKFRRFAFIGFQNEEEAQAALDYFNNTYLDSHKITVQSCTQLGDEKKPRAWSKYAADSAAFKSANEAPENEITASKEKKISKRDKQKKQNIDPVVKALIEKNKSDPAFLEYLEVYGQRKLAWADDGVSDNVKKVVQLAEDNENDSGVEKDDESSDKEIAGDEKISDFEYLKLKTKQKTKEEIKEERNTKYLTLVLRNLPYKVKKRDIKEFFRPLKIDSLRIPRKIKGLAYVGFKTEDKMEKALFRNKSFINGKQIFIHELMPDEKLNGEENDEKNSNRRLERWQRQEEGLKNEESITESGRIFVRNLAYTVTEDDLQKLFEKFGPLTEVVVPIDKITRSIKGYAIITFLMPEHAIKAYTSLDGTIFQGRMLHLLPGKAKDEDENLGETNEGTSFKSKKLKQLKTSAGSAHNWNTLFLGENAVVDAIATSYTTSKEEVLSGDNVAVRLALGETQLVNETRQFLEENGVKLDKFNQIAINRSKTVLLVKNLPANTDVIEIRQLFEKYGILGRVLLPPSGVTAIVEFLEPQEAKIAFRKLAYSKFKSLPLYLEWAPDNPFTTEYRKNEHSAETERDDKKEEFHEEEEEPEPETTLFIKNLNFDTTEDSIRKHFECCGKIADVTVAKKKDPSKPGCLLSMGYGFVQFYTQRSANEALKMLQQSSLDGHTLELKRSNRTLRVEPSVERKLNNVWKQTGSKILVRNIPFEATESEITELFRTFGEIKAIRIPKKMVGTGSHRGFGFVEYFSKSDSKRAMEALCQSTHLYGRRLVLEWAQTDDKDVEYLRKRTALHFTQSTKKRSKKSTIDMEIDVDDEA